MDLYFAYGSNMSGEQIHDRCPSAVFADRAVLSGYRFIINRRGVATVVAQPDGLVRGVCWAISATELEGLDRKEGVKAGTYVRVQLTVECDSGPAVAWVYMASDSSVGTPRIGYLERVLAGAKEHDLPECYRDELTSWAPLSML